MQTIYENSRATQPENWAKGIVPDALRTICCYCGKIKEESSWQHATVYDHHEITYDCCPACFKLYIAPQLGIPPIIE